MKDREFRLDPNKSASENLYSAVSKATNMILRKRHINLTPEERRELVNDICVSAYASFIRNLPKYNRKYNFYQNVSSRVWSVSGNIIKDRINGIRKSLNTESIYSLGSDGTMLVEHIPQFCLSYKPLVRERIPRSLIPALRQQYEYYLGVCEEYGFRPVSFSAYVVRNTKKV